MPDAPLITITDPRDPREPSDLLEAGDEKPPFRLPRKVIAAVTVVVLATVGTAVGIDRYRTHQAELKVQAASFAKADTVHAHVSIAPGAEVGPGSEPTDIVIDPVSGLELPQPEAPIDTGFFEVQLTFNDDPDSLDTVRDLRLLGAGLTPEFDESVLAQRVPGGEPFTFALRSSFPCSEVAAGRYPTYDKVEAVVVPASGREHVITLPVSSSLSPRTMALLSCQLPDPDAVPRVSMQEQHGRFLLDVSGVENARDSLYVVSITSPGLAFARLSREGAPRGLPPGAGELFDVTVRVTDCAAAKASDLSVQVVLRAGAKTYTVTAVDDTPRKGIGSGLSLLRTKVAKACG